MLVILVWKVARGLLRSASHGILGEMQTSERHCLRGGCGGEHQFRGVASGSPPASTCMYVDTYVYTLEHTCKHTYLIIH